MAKFSMLPCLDQDIEAALRTCLEFYGVDPANVQEIKNRVAQLRLEDDTMQWKIDGQLVLEFTREPMGKDSLNYKLRIVKQKKQGQSSLIVSPRGKLLTLREDGHP